MVPETTLYQFKNILGDHWLGMDIGEQDGRYIGGYAAYIVPNSPRKSEQYLSFLRFIEGIRDDIGDKVVVLQSLNYGHYMAKNGTCSMIGAETAQSLPNTQVEYSFIRGAGKQYGIPWFGNVSVYNRWGYKSYSSSTNGNEFPHGPSNGTSLSLMRRLLYSQILYDCKIVGFESGLLVNDTLSSIGKVQQSAISWVTKNGSTGTMYTPVAILLDYFSGWTFPRHLYSKEVYRVWGNLHYSEGDYFADHIFDLIYPGYERASYFHDESGFITHTPYGDIADCLLTDAPLWILKRYPLIIAANEISVTTELENKLLDYVASGGRLVITSGNCKSFSFIDGQSSMQNFAGGQNVKFKEKAILKRTRSQFIM